MYGAHLCVADMVVMTYLPFIVVMDLLNKIDDLSLLWNVKIVSPVRDDFYVLE